MRQGDPVRLCFYGSTGSTSKSLSLFSPGTAATYYFQSTDYLVMTSMSITCSQETNPSAESYMLNLPAGATQSAVNSSTVMLTATHSGPGQFWNDALSDAMGGSQGIIPSILANPTDSTQILAWCGTGYVIHSPGTSVPSWMATK